MSDSGRFDVPTTMERYRAYVRLLAEMQMPANLRSKVDASDLVQEAFARADQKADQFQGHGEEQLVAWLRTILTNVLLDEIKRYSAAKRDVQLERSLQASVDGSAARLEGLLAGEFSSPSRQAMQHEQLAQLAEALERLNEDERRAVTMHHLQGKPLAEVAAALHRGKQAVASLLYRSMAKLKASMS